MESVVFYLKEQGIPATAIIADPHGFDTYDSMRRARYLYDMQQVIIFTQAFHLSRSVYIARRLGIEARGISTDMHTYYDARRFQIRESAARVKAFVEVELLDAIPTSQEKVPLE